MQKADNFSAAPGTSLQAEARRDGRAPGATHGRSGRDGPENRTGREVPVGGL